jgi:hypothetical protein
VTGPLEIDDRLWRELCETILEKLGLPRGVVACGAARRLDELPERGVAGLVGRGGRAGLGYLRRLRGSVNRGLRDRCARNARRARSSAATTDDDDEDGDSESSGRDDERRSNECPIGHTWTLRRAIGVCDTDSAIAR